MELLKDKLGMYIPIGRLSWQRLACLILSFSGTNTQEARCEALLDRFLL